MNKRLMPVIEGMHPRREMLPVLGPPPPPRNKSSDDKGEPRLHDRNLNEEAHVKCSKAYVLEKNFGPKLKFLRKL